MKAVPCGAEQYSQLMDADDGWIKLYKDNKLFPKINEVVILLRKRKGYSKF
jgi:hypothetical protein